MLKQKTVYFREEDLPLWDKIGNKAEWLHEQLNNPMINIGSEQHPVIVSKGAEPFTPVNGGGYTELTLTPPKPTA